MTKVVTSKCPYTSFSNKQSLIFHMEFQALFGLKETFLLLLSIASNMFCAPSKTDQGHLIFSLCLQVCAKTPMLAKNFK